jgi:hypothetical protein
MNPDRRISYLEHCWADNSWSDDPYLTSLMLRTLLVLESRTEAAKTVRSDEKGFPVVTTYRAN